MVWSQTHCVRESGVGVSDEIFILLMISSLGGKINCLWNGGGRLLSISSSSFSFHNVHGFILLSLQARRGGLMNERGRAERSVDSILFCS